MKTIEMDSPMLEALEHPEPGIYDMPAPQYHEQPGASASRLKLLQRSAAHLQAELRNRSAPTDAMQIGTVLHSRILEPLKFERDFVTMPRFELMPGNKTKDGKQSTSSATTFVTVSRQEFELDNLGKTIVSEQDVTMAEQIYDSLMENPDVRMLLECAGAIEASMFWQDPDTGVRCKARMDKRPEFNGQRIVLDLKSAVDASKDGFARAIWNFRYDIQAAYYLDAATRLTGEEHLGFCFLAVEKEPPFAYGLYMLDEQSVQIGREEYQKLLKQWRQCEQDGVWPHYTDHRTPALQEIGLPGWALRKNGMS